MRLCPVLVPAVLGLLAALCAPAFADDNKKDPPAVTGTKPQDLILGKWEPVEEKGKSVVEFLKDGKLKVSADQLALEGTYKFIDDKTMEIKVVFGGKEETVKVKVTVTKDELVTQKEGSETKEKLRRVVAK